MGNRGKKGYANENLTAGLKNSWLRVGMGTGNP